MGTNSPNPCGQFLVYSLIKDLSWHLISRRREKDVFYVGCGVNPLEQERYGFDVIFMTACLVLLFYNITFIINR